MIGRLGSCHPKMSALKLYILIMIYFIKFILYDANVSRISK